MVGPWLAQLDLRSDQLYHVVEDLLGRLLACTLDSQNWLHDNPRVRRSLLVLPTVALSRDVQEQAPARCALLQVATPVREGFVRTMPTSAGPCVFQPDVLCLLPLSCVPIQWRRFAFDHFEEDFLLGQLEPIVLRQCAPIHLAHESLKSDLSASAHH